MKKILLLALCAMASLVGRAVVFNEPLVVTINGMSSTPQTANVQVDIIDASHINFSLKNFKLDDGSGNLMNVGNINVDNLEVTTGEDGFYHFNTTRNISILPGDEAGTTAADWLGPLLGEIPIVMSGKLNEQHLYVNIDIDLMSSLGQIINVKVGDEQNDANSLIFRENIVVTVNEASSPSQSANITVQLVDETHINFILKNFKLDDGSGNFMPVGNIQLNNITLTTKGDHYAFTTSEDITILPGDEPGVNDGEWIGPLLGPIPTEMSGELSLEKLYALININLEALGQIIKVEVGTPFVTAGQKSGIFLRGSFNSWGTTEEAEFLTTSTPGVYEIKNLTFANGSDGFKVADAAWSEACNLGGNGSAISLDVPYYLTGSENIKFPTDNEYICTLITLDLNAKSLTIQGSQGGAQTIEINSLQLRGSINEWGVTEMTQDEQNKNLWTCRAVFPADKSEIKFAANGAWDLNWGSGEKTDGVPNTHTTIYMGGGNISVYNPDGKPWIVNVEVNFTEDYKTADLFLRAIAPEGVSTILATGTLTRAYGLDGKQATGKGIRISEGKKVIGK